MAGDKITSFRTTSTAEQLLRQELFRDGISKKDWLQSKITKDKAQQEIRLSNSESFVTIPCFEYVELLSHAKDHHSFISERIQEHKQSKDFDILMEDIISFCKMNNFLYSRFKLDDYEVVHFEHTVGFEYSAFVLNMITQMIDIDENYLIISSEYNYKSLTLKIKKQIF